MSITKDLLADGQAAAGVRLDRGVKGGVARPGEKGKFVKVPLPAGDAWAGLTLALEEPFDARAYTSLKFDVFLDSSQPVAFNIRIDDAESTDEDYASRFNLGGPKVPELHFKPGHNQLRLSVERIFNGVVNNPPVDVGRLVKIVLFAEVGAPADLYVRRVWLERVPPPAGPALVADFAAGQWPEAWKADPSDCVITDQVDADKGRKLVIKAHALDMPGWPLGDVVTVSPTPADWQAYDQLVLAYANPTDGIVGAGVSISDELNEEVIFCYKLPPGPGEVEIPLASAQAINLAKLVRTAVWFEARPTEDYEMYVRRLSLKRTPGERVILTDSPGEMAGPGDWVIDLSRFYDPRGDRLLADIILPRTDPAEPLVVKCRPQTTQSRIFILPAEYARSCRTDAYRAQGFYVNHGQTLLYFKQDRPVDVNGTMTVKPVDGLGV